MKKLFFKYLVCIFAIAVITLAILLCMLSVRFSNASRHWEDEAFSNVVEKVSQSISSSNGFFDTRTIMSMVDDDRISGYVIRNADGTTNASVGVSSSGTQLSMVFATGLRPSEMSGSRMIKLSRNNVALDVKYVSGYFIVTMKNKSGFAGNEGTVFVPASISATDVIGSIEITVDGHTKCYIDILTYSPKTYQYTKDVVLSCIRVVLVAIPVCLVIALVLSWMLSSKEIEYISETRSSLGRLARGERNIELRKRPNSALNDITTAIEDLDGQLQANDRSKKVWLNGISHDLSTPATAIKMMVDGLNDGVFEATEENLRQLQEDSALLNRRISRVIEFSSLSSGSKAVMSELEVRPFAEGIAASYDREITLDIRKESISCDPSLLEKACIELLDNAAANGDEVTWTIDEDENTYIMKFTNTGCLAEDADLFEPWVRGDWARSGNGSGLGLAITAGIMKLHKGSASLRNDGNGHVVATISWPKA